MNSAFFMKNNQRNAMKWQRSRSGEATEQQAMSCLSSDSAQVILNVVYIQLIFAPALIKTKQIKIKLL